MGKSRTSPLAKTGGGGSGGLGIASGGASGTSSQSTGSSSSGAVQVNQAQVQQVQQVLQSNASSSTVKALGQNIDVSTFTQIGDDQLVQMLSQSRNVDLPNDLNDVSNDMQKFSYYAGLNSKPTVLDSAAFSKYMSDNGISSSEIIARTVDPGQYRLPSGRYVNLSAQQIADKYVKSDTHYIGGKQGGHVYGYGGYFAMNGGGNTGYGGSHSVTIDAVLNKQTARVIKANDISRKWSQYCQTRPKTAAYSSQHHIDISMRAILMGYNVIDCQNSGNYRVVLDRSAIVVRQ